MYTSSCKIFHFASMAPLKDRILITPRELDFVARDVLKLHLKLFNSLVLLDKCLIDHLKRL